jgi:hypothetical protein
MGGGVVGLEEFGEVQGPAPLLFKGQKANEIMECPIETLCLSIPLRVVGGRSRLFDAVELAKLSDDRCFEVTPSVAVQALRDAKALEPCGDEYSSNCGGLLVRGGDGDRVLGENVCVDENVLFAIG